MDNKLPPKHKMLWTYLKSRGRKFKHRLTEDSPVEVEDSEFASRLNTCYGCERYMMDDDGEDRCSHPSCGCYLQEKALLVTETCPEGYWDGDKEMNEFLEGEEDGTRKET
jgi:hypothetical protein